MTPFLVLLGLVLAQSPADSTVNVTTETRLEVALGAGTIKVTTWDRNAVRVMASSGGRTVVRTESAGAVLRVNTLNVRGGVDVANLEITVPRSMNLTLGRGDVDIAVVGSEGQVVAYNYRGRIEINGGRGLISLRSVFGPIVLRNASGRVSAQSTHSEVTLTSVTGDVDAQSTDKAVVLTRIDSKSVRASSISGGIRYSGPLHGDGRYELTTHAGSIVITTSAPVHATINVATVQGAFHSDFPYTVASRQRPSIFAAQVGNGGAQVQLESFSGSLALKAQ